MRAYQLEELREESNRRKADGQHYLALIFSDYADALEEIERLKRSVSEGDVAETLKELRETGFYCESTVQDVIEIIESLAENLADCRKECEEQARLLAERDRERKEHTQWVRDHQADTDAAHRAKQRAESALADAERKGRERQLVSRLRG